MHNSILDSDIYNLSLFLYSRDQMGSRECNVITGFHFEDASHQHILMLEGLRERGVHRMWTELPHHHTQGTYTPFAWYFFRGLNLECMHFIIESLLGSDHFMMWS